MFAAGCGLLPVTNLHFAGDPCPVTLELLAFICSNLVVLVLAKLQLLRNGHIHTKVCLNFQFVPSYARNSLLHGPSRYGDMAMQVTNK